MTRDLGIRYLWIDMLCIVQDDPEDWSRELPKLPDYFANAEFNISSGVKDCNTGLLRRRLPPRFKPTRLHGPDDVFIGWLGTDAYNDPRGLRVSRYPDGWKYESPHIRAWTAQEMGLSRRNLVLQGDGVWPRDPEMICTMLTSQFYMQCHEEIRWENGRRRPEIPESSSEWYDLVEEYSGPYLTFLEHRLLHFFNLALRYSRTSDHHCGEYFAGLWSNDLLRGLLWKRVTDGPSSQRLTTDMGLLEENLAGLWSSDVFRGLHCREVRDGSFPQRYTAPSWSWAACPGRVKHIWPSDATPLASISTAVEDSTDHPGGVAGISLVVRSLLVEINPVGRTQSARSDDIEVNILAEHQHKETLRIRCILDYFDPKTTSEPQLYGIRMTRRLGLLLMDAGHGQMERVGLFIVAKPDTPRWTAITGERDVKII